MCKRFYVPDTFQSCGQTVEARSLDCWPDAYVVMLDPLDHWPDAYMEAWSVGTLTWCICGSLNLWPDAYMEAWSIGMLTWCIHGGSIADLVYTWRLDLLDCWPDAYVEMLDCWPGPESGAVPPLAMSKYLYVVLKTSTWASGCQFCCLRKLKLALPIITSTIH